jgi:hypothetical protein
VVCIIVFDDLFKFDFEKTLFKIEVSLIMPFEFQNFKLSYMLWE